MELIFISFLGLCVETYVTILEFFSHLVPALEINQNVYFALN